MTVSDDLRTRLQADATRWDLDGLYSVDDITKVGRRRKRSRRVAPLMITALFAGLVVAGLSLLSSSGPDATYFTAVGTLDEPFPVHLVATDEGDYVGLAYRELDDGRWGGVLVGSSDGESWTEVVDLAESVYFEAGITGGRGHYLVNAQGQLHIFGIEQSGPATHTVFQLSSSDRREWTATERELVAGPDLAGGLAVHQAVIGGETILLSTIALPDVEEADAMQDQAAPNQEICGFVHDDQQTYHRACGSTEYVQLAGNGGLGVPIEIGLFIAEGDGDFGPVEPAAADDPSRFSGIFPDLFSDGTTVGYAAREALEYRDGDWQVLKDDLAAPSMATARGAERLIAARFVQARRGPTSPIRGMWFFDGTEWDTIDFLSVFEGPEIARLSFASVHAGDAGWVLVASHNEHGYKRARLPDGPVDRHPDGEPFEITNDAGWTFSGHSGWGPAVLRDPAGAEVRRWELFETARPTFEGARLADREVIIVDGDGDRLTSFDEVLWRDLGTHGSTPRVEILWSENGRDWTTVHETRRIVHDVLVGDDHLVVSSHALTIDTQRIELLNEN